MSEPSQQLNISMPEGAAIGVYADFVSVWHTNDIFILDFAALVRPPQATTDGVEADVQVVSRVRIPPGQVFEIMKALEVQLSAWESETESDDD